MDEKQLQEKIIQIGNDLIAQGLTEGTGGNISGRLPGMDWFYMSPSGIPYADIKPEDLVKINIKGEIIGGTRKPSIEHNLHLKVFQNREDVNAVVHTHSTFASAMATLRKDIPPILDSMVATFGGPLRVADYAIMGSMELAENVSKVLKTDNGALVANHGAIAIGETFDQAMGRCHLIEKISQIMLLANGAGTPVAISEENIEKALKFLKNNYGQKK